MKIYIASDHAGFELKKALVEHLKTNGHEVEDCGADEFDMDDDYPDFISKAAEAVSKNPDETMGIVLGGSGQAEMMLANKFKNVRCALFYTPVAPVGAADVSGRMSEDQFEMLRLTREHNNANMLSLGARFLTEDEAKKAVDLWLSTKFTGEERHERRINKIKEYEQEKH